MADEEAAFLSSMQAANDAAGEYEAAGEASEQRTESESSDEYDPSQALPTETTPAPLAQDSNVQFSSDVSPLHNSFSNASNAPLTSTSTPASLPFNDAFASDRQSLSRSMSRASSQSTETGAVTIPRPEPSQAIPNISGHNGGRVHSGGDSILDMGKSQSACPASDPNLNFSTNHVYANNVTIPNGVQEKKHSSIVPNGVTDTDPNLAAVVPDTGASFHNDSTAKPAETLAGPSAKETRPQPKEKAATPAVTIPKARLPHDKIGILEDRIKDDTRGDLDAWLSLIDEHKKRGKLDDARSVYERFLAVFPSAVCFALNQAR